MLCYKLNRQTCSNKANGINLIFIILQEKGRSDDGRAVSCAANLWRRDHLQPNRSSCRNTEWVFLLSKCSIFTFTISMDENGSVECFRVWNGKRLININAINIHLHYEIILIQSVIGHRKWIRYHFINNILIILYQ